MLEHRCLCCKNPLPKRRRKYCSDICATEYFVAVLKPLLWGNATQLALERAGNHCEDCGGLAPLEVHHIIPLEPGEARWNSPKNRQVNLTVLCRPCHEKAHHPLLEPVESLPSLDSLEEAQARGQLVMEALI